MLATANWRVYPRLFSTVGRYHRHLDIVYELLKKSRVWCVRSATSVGERQPEVSDVLNTKENHNIQSDDQCLKYVVFF